MSQPKTLGIAIVALLLLIGAGFAAAQSRKCLGNREAVSALLTDDNGEPATTEQIDADFRPTIGRDDITLCLNEGQRLSNHLIDYDDYVRALRASRISGDRQLAVRNSVLWLRGEGVRVDLSRLGERRIVSRPIRWTDVVLGPQVSGRNTVFGGRVDFRRATFHGRTTFDGATFNGAARFYRGAAFRGPASFRGVQFSGDASFYSETTFHGPTTFEGAVFDGAARFYSGTTFRGPASFRNVQFGRDAYFHNKTTFHANTSFAGATFGESADSAREDAGEAFFHAGTTFLADVDFEGATFNVKPHFRADTFEDSVSFDNAVFQVRAPFQGIVFPGSTSFRNTQFNEVASFGKAVFNMGASFQHAVFHQQTSFIDAQFRLHADFMDARFLNGATGLFIGSIFDGEADFGRARFTGTSRFQRAQFNMGASFEKTVFNRQIIFEGAQFRQHADFDGVAFAKGARVSFAGSIFDVEAAFGGITFFGPAWFQGAQFNKGAFFEYAEFRREAIFEGATFAGYLSFRKAEIQETLRLVGATWEGRADFRESVIGELDWDSENRPSTVKGVFDARGAELKSLTIKDVHFSDLADFSRAYFGKKAPGTEGRTLFYDAADFSGTTMPNTAPRTERRILFEDVIFEKAADFLRADFQADVFFVDNRFRGVLDLTNASFETDARLCLLDNRIGQLLMDRKHLTPTPAWWQLFWKLSANRLLESRFRAVTPPDDTGTAAATAKAYACAEPNQSDSDHEQLQKIYRSIESSFRNTNDSWGENEAWYLGTVASRKAWRWFSYIPDAIIRGIPSRYGIDYARALALSILCVLVFWAWYWVYFRWFFREKHLKTCQESPRIKLASPPELRRALRFRPFERLFHSASRENPCPRHPIPWRDALFLSWRAFFKLGLGSSYPRALAPVVYFEWFIGMIMLIHLVFVLKNTLSIALPFLGG